MPSLAILSDQKLAAPLAEIAREYTRRNKIACSLAFVSREEEAALITDGAYADIFITAHPQRVEMLMQQGVADIHSGLEVARNRLVLVGNATTPLSLSLKSGFPVAALVNAMQGESLLLVGNPETLEEGSTAREALRSMGVSADMESYILYIKTLPQMLRMVGAQQAYALVYMSDARTYPDIAVLDSFPVGSYTSVAYRAAVLAGDKMEESRAFVAFLRSVEAQLIFAKYGLERGGD